MGLFGLWWADWRLALVGYLASLLCVLPLASIIAARWLGRRLRRTDRHRQGE